MNIPNPMQDEKELLCRLNDGDPHAFTEIYNLYWKKVFYLAASKLQDLAEAEEIVQEIFLDLWKRRQDLHISTCLSSYLSACVKYKVINVLARKVHRHRFQRFSRLSSDGTNHSTEEYLQFGELKEALEKETDKLPDQCRLVFRLSREEGYSHKEIAALMGISPKTVESHLTRALRSLKLGLSQFLGLFFLSQSFLIFC